MHGGAEGSGTAAGNRNALKRGSYSHEAIKLCRRLLETTELERRRAALEQVRAS
jgi:hypothetical protein